MFKQARIKLTLWYLAIIMAISLFFSLVIYQGATFELTRIERVQRFRRPIPTAPFAIDPEVIEETKQRISLALAAINLVILGISGAAGYFLAGRTLKPIKETVDEQSRFISDASHELKTPLTTLKSEIEVGLRDKKLGLANAKSLLVSNLEEVDKIQKLANYLLTLHRFEDNKTKLSFSQINLRDIAKEAADSVKKLAKAKKITISRHLESAKVTGNQDSLVQAVVILLENAIKYSPAGEKVIVKTQKGRTLTVQDFGPGIKKQDIPHIFDRFYRADTSRNKEKIDGFGLGLSIVKSIIDLHQGSVKVTSKIGKGTAFRVQL